MTFFFWAKFKPLEKGGDAMEKGKCSGKLFGTGGRETGLLSQEETEVNYGGEAPKMKAGEGGSIMDTNYSTNPTTDRKGVSVRNIRRRIETHNGHEDGRKPYESPITAGHLEGHLIGRNL